MEEPFYGNGAGVQLSLFEARQTRPTAVYWLPLRYHWLPLPNPDWGFFAYRMGTADRRPSEYPRKHPLLKGE
jgi:hypothetical protein